MKNIDAIKKFYDDATIRKLHGLVYANRRVEYAWQSIETVLAKKKPKTVIEIGCGIGEICFRLAKAVKDVSVVGFDISNKSVEIASKLFPSDNLAFLRADSISQALIPDAAKFDLIILIDVYEHIPIAQREELHQFIKKNIAGEGTVFISCPTPQHLDYLRKNQPSEIQPVDENISLAEIQQMATATGLTIQLYKEVSVWKQSDYFHCIFINRSVLQPCSDFAMKSTTNHGSLKKAIKNKIKSKIVVSKPVNHAEVKKELIKTRLGSDILDKVEAFGR